MALSDFESFRAACDNLRLKTTNCEVSQIAFAEARSVVEIVASFRKFWVSVVKQVPDLFVELMDEFYATFRDDMNAAGVYYNEPPIRIDGALVFIGNAQFPVHVDHGHVRAIILGEAHVSISDHVRGECHCEKAVVSCLGYSSLKLHKGTAFAYDHSRIEGSGSVSTFDFSSADICDGVIDDHGHSFIKAKGDTVVQSFTSKNIELSENSQLILIDE